MKVATNTATEWEVTKRGQWAERCSIIAQLMAMLDLADYSARDKRMMGRSPLELGAAKGEWWLLLTAPQRKKYEELVKALEALTNLLDPATGETAPYDKLSRRREVNRMHQRKYRQRLKAQEAFMVQQMRARQEAEERARTNALKAASANAFDESTAEAKAPLPTPGQTREDALRSQAEMDRLIAAGAPIEAITSKTPQRSAAYHALMALLEEEPSDDDAPIEGE
jgi:hypothetical protein